MVLRVNVFEAGGVHVGIDLRGADIGVTEEFLDDAEIGAAREQVGCEGVTEDVGVNVCEAGHRGVLLDDLPDGDPLEGAGAV